MTPIEAVAVDNSDAMKAEALAWPDRARALSILGTETYIQAGELLKGIKALRQTIAATFDPHIKRAFDAHRALCREKQDAEAPLLEAEQILKRGLVAYDTEQERLRREEERRRQDEARRIEEVRRLEEAATLEQEAHSTGDGALLDQAMELLEMPVPTPVVAVEKTTPKVQGVTYRETWSAKVISPLALVKFVAAHPEHINLVSPNLTALNQLARAMKGAMKVDGVQAVSEKSVAASAR